jgi:hypothetical protein
MNLKLSRPFPGDRDDAPGAAERTPWEIVLPDESATEDLGRFLAEILRPGDLVALSGGSSSGPRRR